MRYTPSTSPCWLIMTLRLTWMTDFPANSLSFTSSDSSPAKL